MARRLVVAGDLFHGRVPVGAVYVGRAAPGLPASRWANPHRVSRAGGRCGTCRAAGVDVEHDQVGAVKAFATDLEHDPALLAAAPTELAGRDLACWCRTGPCHADVLLHLANHPAVDLTDRPGGPAGPPWWTE